MAGGLCLVTVLLVTLGANAVSGVTIPAVPGSTITLSCNKIPSTNLIWEHWDSKRIIIRSGVVTNSVTSSKYVVAQRQDSESVAVSSVTLSDDGQYRCYYSTSPADAQVMNINVLVRPQTVYASGPTDPVSQATIQILTCEVKVAKPLPEVKWIRKDYGGNFTEFAGTNQDWYFQNKTGSRVNTLRVNVTRKAYKAVFICQAAISYFYTIQFNVTLDVFLLPLAPVISGLAPSYDPGTPSSLLCTARGARPAADISWSLNGQKIESINSLPEISANGTFVSTSTLMMTTPFRDEDATVTCSATNTAVQHSGLPAPASSITLRINYAPTVKLNFTLDVVNEGEDAVLNCVVSSRPLPEASEIKWLKGDTVTSGGRYTVGNASNPYLLIRDVNRHDSGTYRCHVSNHLGFAESESITLVVHYRPYCSVNHRTKYAVPTGYSAKIRCVVGAFPNDVAFRWINPSIDGRVSVSITRGVVEHSDPYHAVSYQNVSISRKEDYRSVICNASNSIGAMLESCYIHIVPPGPSEAPTNCSVRDVTNGSLILTCRPGFDGGYPQTFILYQSQPHRHFQLAQIWDTPQFLVTGLLPNTSYNLRVCSRNEKYPSNENCSSILTARTLSGSSSALPDGEVQTAGIGAYIAIPICLLLIIVFIALFLVYWRVYRAKRDDKLSPGRVVVARSTGSLVFDRGSQRWRKYFTKGSLKPAMTAGKGDLYRAREKQLQAIVDRIDWREGLRDVDYKNRCADTESAAADDIELTDSISGRESKGQRTRPDGNTMTVSCHLHGTETGTAVSGQMNGDEAETDHNGNGVLNCAFEDSGAIGVVKQNMDMTYLRRRLPTESETDCEGSSETTVTGMDRMAASGSEMDSGSPRKLYSDSDRKSDCSTLRSGHYGDGVARSGSYNIAISGNDDSSSKSASTTTSGAQSTFCHLQDERYQGIEPVYF